MRAKKTIWKAQKPELVAIVGGSGAGKTWLTKQLQTLLGKEACCLSLDDFYRDRSHLKPARRARINFDHPRAIDWIALKKVLKHCAEGKPAYLPEYDFTTHCRKKTKRLFRPKPLVLVEGLWLLRLRSVRQFFSCKIFLDCPQGVRLQRRLARDCKERGRDAASVRSQFRQTVSPMHDRFVAPQARWADIRLRRPQTAKDVVRLAEQLNRLSHDHSIEPRIGTNKH